MQQVGADPEEGAAENDFTRVKPRMLLQLLIPARGLAVAFRRIHDATARDALILVGQAENPPEPDTCREGQYAIEISEHRHALYQVRGRPRIRKVRRSHSNSSPSEIWRNSSRSSGGWSRNDPTMSFRAS